MDPEPSEAEAHLAGEFSAISRWCKILPCEGEQVRTGPGDDAAWLRWRGNLAVSTDSFIEDVHFARSWSDGRAVGRRALAAALSDLAASRARPLGCVIAVAAPQLDSYVDRVVEGIAEGAKEWNCPVVGGDTTSSRSGLVLNITVLGEATAAGPLLRSGAQVGDLLQLSGPLGGSASAVEQLLAGKPAAWPEVRPRLDLLEAIATATAGIDISDGLLADAEHVAKASGYLLELDPMPGWSHHALCGGEDYELLVTAPKPLDGFETIGRVRQGQGIRFSDGTSLPARPWGFIHGSKQR